MEYCNKTITHTPFYDSFKLSIKSNIFRNKEFEKHTFLKTV